MTDLRDTAVAWLREARPAVVVEVESARGSVPRGAGTRMLVAADAELGTIGGGHLEWQAIAHARLLLAGGTTDKVQSFALGPSLGQCCGGAVTLQHALLDAQTLARWPAEAPLFTLQLYGAGHVGRAIVRLLTELPCRVQWIDEREEQFPADPLPAHIECVCVEPVQAEVAAAPAGACYLVLTHSHDLDLAISQAILQRGDFAYFGLIGSATKRARFERRFEARGVAPALIGRMHCPIGMPGIAGKSPAVIAVAVVAQLLQSQSGRGADQSPATRSSAARLSSVTV